MFFVRRCPDIACRVGVHGPDPDIAIIAAGLVTAFLWPSAWPDLIVGLGIAQVQRPGAARAPGTLACHAVQSVARPGISRMPARPMPTRARCFAPHSRAARIRKLTDASSRKSMLSANSDTEPMARAAANSALAVNLSCALMLARYRTLAEALPARPSCRRGTTLSPGAPPLRSIAPRGAVFTSGCRCPRSLWCIRRGR